MDIGRSTPDRETSTERDKRLYLLAESLLSFVQEIDSLEGSEKKMDC